MYFFFLHNLFTHISVSPCHKLSREVHPLILKAVTLTSDPSDVSLVTLAGPFRALVRVTCERARHTDYQHVLRSSRRVFGQAVWCRHINSAFP